jgi:hypothetical protein
MLTELFCREVENASSILSSVTAAGGNMSSIISSSGAAGSDNSTISSSLAISDCKVLGGTANVCVGVGIIA